MLTKGKSLALAATGIIVPTLVARAARSATGLGYKAITNHAPPKNPAHPRVGWKEAIAWTVSSAIIGGLARLAARRWMSETAIPLKSDGGQETIED